MHFSSGGDGLAILQLRKWEPSQNQVNLSEFREGFISPTRQILLLLSYHCDALLLPLNKGASQNSNAFEVSNCESAEIVGSSAFYSQGLTSDIRSDSVDDIPCTSGSATNFDNDVSSRSNIPMSSSYAFISDVNSLAWGLCGDTYNQHQDDSFRELLFVSGNHGVTVHAFRQPDKTSKPSEDTLEGEFGQGRWVDWEPVATSARSGSSFEASRNTPDSDRANGAVESTHRNCKEVGDDESLRRSSSKRWLRSFFTQVEHVESDHKLWTKLPEKPSFPSSAGVVSFNLFDSNSALMDILSCDNVSNLQESWKKNVLYPNADASDNCKSEVPSKISSSGMNSSYKCSRVFSSNSHDLVGFVLEFMDPKSISSSDECRHRNKTLLVIATIGSCGIKWVSSVKLEEIVTIGPVVEWTDFCFSDNLLVCLNASGLIYIYAAISGEYVAQLDVVQASGLNPQSSVLDQKKPYVDPDVQIKQIHDKSASRHGHFVGRKFFRRLIVASDTSLLAAVDEYGVIYVLCTVDYMPNKHNPSDWLLPYFQNLGLGILVGWEVGGSQIGHPSVHSNLSLSQNTDELRKMEGQNLHGRAGGDESFLSGFFTPSNTKDEELHVFGRHPRIMRKFFLPTHRSSDDDFICFSPFGITRLSKNLKVKDKKHIQIVHFNLHAESVIRDDMCLISEIEMCNLQMRDECRIGEAVGCIFQGFLYLVSQGDLSVVLPSISVSNSQAESIGIPQPSRSAGIEHQPGKISEIKESKQCWSPWKIEVLDRVILYEGPDVADRLCSENGWDLKISRMRRLQLALEYLKFHEIEQSLEMLASVNLAEEGILRLLFTVAYVISHKVGNDNEVSAASRLLALGTRFATNMIRKYALLQQKRYSYLSQGVGGRVLSLPPVSPDEVQDEMGNSRRFHEMAHLLEIIRNLQLRLSAKFRRPGSEPLEAPVDSVSTESRAKLAVLPVDPVLLEASPVSVMAHNKLDLVPVESLNSNTHLDVEDSGETSALVPQLGVLGKKVLPLENPKEMIARWKLDNLDLKTVVKDALLSGRLPLAVLQLHLHRSEDLISDKEPHDTFTEVRDTGRAIAYDLFLKGETQLAVATLQRLGEDIEISLKQLMLGTVRRCLRVQIADEMKRYGYLGAYEWKILERIALIERLYPSCSFWKTFNGRQKEYDGRVTSKPNAPEQKFLHLLYSHLFKDLTIECDEIDGVILGSWANVNQEPSGPMVDEDSAHAGYWAAAAVWSNAWDQRTIDRIVLDQPFSMGVHVLWESQLEYFICHNNWEEVLKLLDLIPTSLLSDGYLQVNLSLLQPATTVRNNRGLSEYGNYICSIEDLDAVCMDVPGVKFFSFPANIMCSTWLRTHMEQELAKKLIFFKEYWEGTAEIVPLLARSGYITSIYQIPYKDDSFESSSDRGFSNIGGMFNEDTMQALHKLLIHHCAQHNLPNLLDIYLDHHNLVRDDDSLGSFLDAAGDCHWAKWLLFSRIKGREYEASFSNARSMMSCNLVPATNLSALEIDEIIRTVDDIAEGGGELAALATLVYAPIPIQSCLSSGTVNRYSGCLAQCTLENLRPTLQRFPTLWRTIVAACFGQDATYNFLGPKAKNVFGNSSLSNYLNWRDTIFFSSGYDTSLLQMLPCWFPKAVRQLIQLYVQGPLGWQSVTGLSTMESVHRDINLFVNADDHTVINAVSWEATIQKHLEEELYDSSLEETGLGLEHHLHRGRALAAFNHILRVRVRHLKSERQSGGSVHGQTNVQSDVQTLLAPITETEESLLSSVCPLAIMHFEDSVLVCSCAFLLELCGLSAGMLRVDIAALRRISSFYKSSRNIENYRQIWPKASAVQAVSPEGNIVDSLARALADDYLHQEGSSINNQRESLKSVSRKQPLRALMLVLQHLEKASLPLVVDGQTCGSWLLSGSGDGSELRGQQKAASQHWNLVKVFCQMHQLPLSTRYLALLARDNDWVGFLTEAQAGGYPFDTVLQVASKEFSDPRLKVHILTVLKGMRSRRKATSSSYSDTGEKRSENPVSDENFVSDENVYVAVELFGILAECEKQKCPGEALLVKAKEMSWSILALIASCFPDVSSLSCLTVWLEITAARETSSIKVNDIASKIANNVGAAVDATNSLPTSNRALTVHYNRQNSKRRRIMESTSIDPLVATFNGSSIAGARVLVDQNINTDEEQKKEASKYNYVSSDSDEGVLSLSRMIAVLCEQRLFLPLLRAFEMFLPSCSLLPFIRALQAFSQMRLSEASAHLGSFSARIKEEPTGLREGHVGTSWISSTAVKAADAMLSTCPSPYEKRCLLQLLAVIDFGDGGPAATYYRRLYWKINLAEPLLRKDNLLHLGDESLDDASLLTVLEKNGHWEQARNWARQLEASGGPWRAALHHVTETQAESMVAEWKEFLWDVPEERVALWGHCQTLFIRYSFPPLQAGLFFLKHAEAVEKDLPARELHELLLLSLQWLSGMITMSSPVYPLHLLREIETRVWLLAVESEAQVKSEGEFTSSARDPLIRNSSNIIDRTASVITKMDNHTNSMRNRTSEKHDLREANQTYQKNQVLDTSFSTTAGGTTKTKRRAKGYLPSRRPVMDSVDKGTDSEDGSSPPTNVRNDLQSQDENTKIEMPFSRWEERVEPAELERAVLSLLEFGQVAAAKQLQYKLSPTHIPSEFRLVDAALVLASMSTSSTGVHISVLDDEVHSVIQSYNISTDKHLVEPMQVLESLATLFTEGSGRGLCKRILAVRKAANVLGLTFSEAFNKQPIEVLQLLSLKAQESFEEAKLLVQTHSMPASSIAQILAESFLKGLLAAHRGGYMDSQKEEGPAPLLWRFSDFLKWAELCPSEPEIGHALMRLVITGQEIPHACEVELLILSHHFYKSSACLDGVDVLVALATTRVEAYVSEGDFPCLARLLTGVGSFHALNFILGILIENGQLDLLLQKYSSAARDSNTGTTESVRGFRLAVLTSLKHFNSNDLDAFATVYNHFDMKHETAALLESRAEQSSQQWFHRYDKDQNEELLDAMRYFIEAAEVHSSIDAGNKTRRACAKASLVSLQIRMPDFQWLNLSETNARRALVEQSRFQEALIVAEAYGLNQPSEWALVLWNQMLKPELTEEFVAEFVAVLPLHPSMLVDLARFYRAEVAARGDQSQFSVWLTGGGLPAEWAKYLERSFRCLLKRTRDLRLRLQLASVATGFTDVNNACSRELDRVPDTAGPLVLRKGHGGAYLPLM